MIRVAERLALRIVRALDATATRLGGWRWNPFHQSGALAFWLLLVLIVTGLYLLVFYRIGGPWDSVQRLDADPWLGQWIRSLHRYASDLMVLAVVGHAVRMFAHARSWGPRTLAWISGVLLLLFVFVSGWTGFVLVWDTFGAQLAVAGARLFDALPIFSEPLRRIFAGDRPIPSAFFFVNLFLHVAIPLLVAAGIWIHVTRVARPTFLPPKALGMAVLVALIALSVALPAPLAPSADPLALPDTVPVNLVYGFWMPWVDRMPTWAGWTAAGSVLLLGLMIPRLARRPRTGTWTPSVVDERRCTGCEQCVLDCPWEAIAMHPRTDGRETLVARVDPAKCVSCGICAGSCAPMGVGPADRTGLAQVAGIREFLLAPDIPPAPVVAIACENAAPTHLDALRHAGATVRPVPCTGNLHTSVIELALRGGAAGVIVYSCVPRDCRGREGPKWLEQRVHHEREAELQPRVDRRRVRLATMTPGDLPGTLAAWHAFAADVRALGTTEGDLELEDAVCEPVPMVTAEEER